MRFWRIGSRLRRRKTIPKQFSSVMKRREPAKIAVTIPTTSSQPALVLSRVAHDLDDHGADPCRERPHDVIGDKRLGSRRDVSEDIAGDGENEDEQWEDRKEEVVGEQAGEVEDPVVVDLDPERGDGGDRARECVALSDGLIEIRSTMNAVDEEPPECVDALHLPSPISIFECDAQGACSIWWRLSRRRRRGGRKGWACVHWRSGSRRDLILYRRATDRWRNDPLRDDLRHSRHRHSDHRADQP